VVALPKKLSILDFNSCLELLNKTYRQINQPEYPNPTYTQGQRDSTLAHYTTTHQFEYTRQQWKSIQRMYNGVKYIDCNNDAHCSRK
jgi:hypothetical protein